MPRLICPTPDAWYLRNELSIFGLNRLQGVAPQSKDWSSRGLELSFSGLPALLNVALQPHRRWDSTGELAETFAPGAPHLPCPDKFLPCPSC